MVETVLRSVLDSVRRSALIRLLLIGFLVLLLQIPVAMIQDVISERISTRSQALREITASWGGEQFIAGPRLVVPYLKNVIESVEGMETRVRREAGSINFLPETLKISGTLESEVRYRGIFEFPVYRTDLRLQGSFSPPDFSATDLSAAEILWEQSRLVLNVSDQRSIQQQTVLRLGRSEIEFLPGTLESDLRKSGIHAPVGETARDGLEEFEFPLSLSGSESIFFAPFGSQTEVELTSTWKDPSFQGAWLPTERSVSDQGFTARWQIPLLGRNYAQSWDAKVELRRAIQESIQESLFGVRLISPVDEYRMAERSTKYAALFILLTFGSLWLLEILAKVRIHSLQYLLVGAAMCLFYLLELSLSEPLGFLLAYVLAALSVVTLVFAYGIAILRSRRRASILSGILTGLYGYLYVLLMNQDYALLIGSIGLFLILVLVMYLTRKVDWYSIGS